MFTFSFPMTLTIDLLTSNFSSQLLVLKVMSPTNSNKFCGFLISTRSKARDSHQTDGHCGTLRHVLSVTPGNCLLWIMHTELHWLDVPERIKYKLGMLMYRCHCQHNKAPRYLMAHCTSDLTSLIVNGYVLPVVMKSLFHVTGSVPMDVGHLPLLARLSGTFCQRTCGIWMFLRRVTGSH